jgi:hypothetical protein
VPGRQPPDSGAWEGSSSGTPSDSIRVTRPPAGMEEGASGVGAEAERGRYQRPGRGPLDRTAGDSLRHCCLWTCQILVHGAPAQNSLTKLCVQVASCEGAEQVQLQQQSRQFYNMPSRHAGPPMLWREAVRKMGHLTMSGVPPPSPSSI